MTRRAAAAGRRPAKAGSTRELGRLSSLRSLVVRDFGLRHEGCELSRDELDALLRTKLERLVLVDVPSRVELHRLAGLPTLRELVVVGKFDDSDVQRLGEIPTLRRLVLRNGRTTADTVTELREALPQCRVDWRLDAKWFDPCFAFVYEPRADR